VTEQVRRRPPQIREQSLKREHFSQRVLVGATTAHKAIASIDDNLARLKKDRIESVGSVPK
jgi:hypothetical protein